MKLIMPMAGLGSRFKEQVKPLIDVGGVPMFVHAERCIGIDFEERIFITRAEHNLTQVIHSYYPDAHVIEIDYTTEGTACTLLLAKLHWKDGDSIFVSNCDQHVDWNYNTDWASHTGAIAVFDCPDRNPKWSYAQTDEYNHVTRVAEKDPISDLATVGWYYWRDGRDLEASIHNMMLANDRVNNEFYTCPTYNHLIAHEDDATVVVFAVDKMQGIGTPEDLLQWQTYN